MAKTSGPLFSVSASGTVGKVITYSTWHGRSYVRRRVIPLNPMLLAQEAVRNAMRAVGRITHWASITTKIADGETLPDRDRIKAVAPSDQAWNGALGAAIIGPNQQAFIDANAAYALIVGAHGAAWDAAAEALPLPSIPQKGDLGVDAAALTTGNVFYLYASGLSVLGLGAVPGDVPPVYA